jgi:uncharacterized protein (DUF1697 family)
MSRYLALLRGINVGGNNVIRMDALKRCFDEHGFSEVVTYIQSGNVIFEAKERSRAALTRRIEAMLAERFAYRATVVLRSRQQLQQIVGRAPRGFGDEPKSYRYDVLFLQEGLTAAAALDSVPTREGVDEVWAGPGVLYFSRLIRRATQSHLSRLVSLPIYKRMTIRNWNTTTKLLALMEA